MSVTLKGMTWSHPRGYDPLGACSRLWQEKTGAAVAWDKRSLQDFESFPVETLARAYDLIVIDHPHVGRITAENCLVPLDLPERHAECAALKQGSLGQSYPSYHWQGRQWAFPIDAAAQVQAWRADRLDAPPATWSHMLDLAARGQVAIPLRPPHVLMSFFTLAGNLGRPCSIAGPALIDSATGIEVYERIAELAARVDPICLDQDPIAVFEAMAQPDSKIACVPLIYGYVSYARDGFRPARIAFADLPALGHNGPVGSALGGTGIAVSAHSEQRAAAIDFAYWIASAAVQSGPYAAAGGQPGHAAAWSSAAVNTAVDGFYTKTRATLDGAWVRPRHDGYMAFQERASECLIAGLKNREPAKSVIDDLNALFATSFD
ncbi:extracellular solute-binding protein [Dongia sedimenti]|uniref:Extracellular solute-binding protein n=1 Tax=Dongia sedimenti TaxID=3064282 RepID=A0ABU0YKX6_9PROT|nr:extracellular solute-binding protein [Rhodospirillaceae bacterium R-7]